MTNRQNTLDKGMIHVPGMRKLYGASDKWIICVYVCMYVCMCVCVCVYIMEYYSAKKKNEILPLAAVRMYLE